MGQRVNPNIIRIVNNNEWKSKYFEKKATDSPVLEVKDMKIRDFIFKFFKNNKLTVSNCNIFYLNNALHILLSYYQNYESIHLIKKILKNQGIKIKNVTYNKKLKRKINNTSIKFNTCKLKKNNKKQLKLLSKNYFKEYCYKFINYKTKLKKKIDFILLKEKYFLIKIKKMLKNTLLKKKLFTKLTELINKYNKLKIQTFNEIEIIKKNNNKQQKFLKKFIKIKVLKNKIKNNKLSQLNSIILKKKINTLLELNKNKNKKKINTQLELNKNKKKNNSNKLTDKIRFKKLKKEIYNFLFPKKKNIEESPITLWLRRLLARKSNPNLRLKIKKKNSNKIFSKKNSTFFLWLNSSIRKYNSNPRLQKKKMFKIFNKITLKKLKSYLYYYIMFLFKKKLVKLTKNISLKYKLKKCLIKSFFNKQTLIKYHLNVENLQKIKQKNLSENILNFLNKKIINKIKLRLPTKISKLFKKKLKKKNKKFELYHRLAGLTKYKKILYLTTNNNVKNLKTNSFIETFFESLSKFLKNKMNLKLIIRPLNKEIYEKSPEITKLYYFKKALSFKLRRFIQYKHTYIRETLNTLFTCLNTENTENLLANLISTQIGKLRKNQLKNHHHFVNFVNIILKFFFYFAATKKIKKWSVKSIRIEINGRFNRAPRSVRRIIKIGKKFPKITLNSPITYAESTSYAVNGTLGVKVWVLHWGSGTPSFETFLKKINKFKKLGTFTKNSTSEKYRFALYKNNTNVMNKSILYRSNLVKPLTVLQKEEVRKKKKKKKLSNKFKEKPNKNTTVKTPRNKLRNTLK